MMDVPSIWAVFFVSQHQHGELWLESHLCVSFISIIPQRNTTRVTPAWLHSAQPRHRIMYSPDQNNGRLGWHNRDYNTFIDPADSFRLYA